MVGRSGGINFELVMKSVMSEGTEKGRVRRMEEARSKGRDGWVRNEKKC